MKEEVCAVPYGVPPIIRADKIEEFLNIKRSEEVLKIHKRLSKFNYIVTDNTERSNPMERLVYKDNNEYIQIKDYENKMCYEICDDCNANCDKCVMTKVLKLVADYQDTKLKPEQIEKLKEKKKTLAKENRKLKKEMLKMLNHAWYNQEDEDEQE